MELASNIIAFPTKFTFSEKILKYKYYFNGLVFPLFTFNDYSYILPVVDNLVEFSLLLVVFRVKLFYAFLSLFRLLQKRRETLFFPIEQHLRLFIVGEKKNKLKTRA